MHHDDSDTFRQLSMEIIDLQNKISILQKKEVRKYCFFVFLSLSVLLLLFGIDFVRLNGRKVLQNMRVVWKEFLLNLKSLERRIITLVFSILFFVMRKILLKRNVEFYLIDVPNKLKNWMFLELRLIIWYVFC